MRVRQLLMHWLKQRLLTATVMLIGHQRGPRCRQWTVSAVAFSKIVMILYRVRKPRGVCSGKRRFNMLETTSIVKSEYQPIDDAFRIFVYVLAETQLKAYTIYQTRLNV